MSSKSISWPAPGSPTTYAAGSSGEESLPQAEIATASAISASVAAGGGTALRRSGRRQLFDHPVSRAQSQGRDRQRRVDPERGGNACPVRDVKALVDAATRIEDVAELVAHAGDRGFAH